MNQYGNVDELIELAIDEGRCGEPLTVVEATGSERVVEWNPDWCDCERCSCVGECDEGDGCEACDDARRALAMDVRHWERGRL